MPHSDGSHIVNELPNVQGTSNILGGLSSDSQGFPDSHHVDNSQQGISEMLEVRRQESRVATADVIPARLFSEVTPLQHSPNRWVAPSLNNSAMVETFTPRKAKYRFTGLLNKLTGKNIGFTCDKIVDWITKCELAVQNQVLQAVIKLIFDRAILELERMVIYIDLCVILAKVFDCTREQSGTPSLMISNYLSECWLGAFQLGYLS